MCETNEVRIKTSRSGGNDRQETDITRKKIVEVAMFCDFVIRSLLEEMMMMLMMMMFSGRSRLLRERCSAQEWSWATQVRFDPLVMTRTVS